MKKLLLISLSLAASTSIVAISDIQKQIGGQNAASQTMPTPLNAPHEAMHPEGISGMEHGGQQSGTQGTIQDNREYVIGGRETMGGHIYYNQPAPLTGTRQQPARIMRYHGASRR